MLYLIFGSAASGKSKYAEDIAVKLRKPLFYVATMKPFGDEGIKRIKKHRQNRMNKGFSTIECYNNLVKLQFPKRGTVLLECLGNLLANEMFSAKNIDNSLCESLYNSIFNVYSQSENLVIVTNDVFSEGGDYSEETRQYLKNLAFLNNSIAKKADYVIEVYYSIPIFLKGEKDCIF